MDDFRVLNAKQVERRKPMKTYYLVLIILLFFLTSGCYANMTGTVVDAETGKPIEGAVVLVEWTKTKGIGLTYHEVEKIMEVATDKEGKFNVSGVSNPFVDPPMIVVYKEGYIAWRNDYIFPGFKKRTDFKYKNEIKIKLDKFKEEYSHDEHHSFMGHGIMISGLTSVPRFHEILNEESKKATLQREQQKTK